MLIATYARAATKVATESGPQIDRQLSQIRRWARQNGHSIVREYVDIAASGNDMQREQLQRMIHDARVKPPLFEAIVVESMCRLARSAIVLSTLQRLFARRGIKLIETQESFYDANAISGRMFPWIRK